MATTPLGVPIPPARITRREPGVGWMTRNIEMPLLGYQVTRLPGQRPADHEARMRQLAYKAAMYAGGPREAIKALRWLREHTEG